MQSLIEKLTHWVIRYFLIFVVIITVLIAGNFLLKEYNDHKPLEALKDLERTGKVLDSHRLKVEGDLLSRIAKLETASLDVLNSRVSAIDIGIKQKLSEKHRLGNGLSLLISTPVGVAYVEQKKLEVEIILLQQELDYLKQLIAFITVSKELESLRVNHVIAYNKLRVNESAQNRLETENPLAINNPVYYEYWRLKTLQKDRKPLVENNQSANVAYQQKNKLVQAIKESKREFNIKKDQIDAALLPIQITINEQKKRIEENWFKKATGKINEVVWAAAGILLAIILVPVAIKAFLYFVLAPLASRRPPICLLPEVSGAIEGVAESTENGLSQTKVSAVSLQLNVDKGQELLIHSEYLQSSSVSGVKDTKWFLNNSYPLSSLASGMVALTRIRSTSYESIVISSMKDPLSEVGIISLPIGSAVAMQPRGLVGVLYRKDMPIRITRHWRLFSLNAWLTLQLRYLIFHGPAKLIVKGCRGIRVERAGTGRRIKQSATIGFSANLQYSTTRCETFTPYLMGKEELLDDSFAGDYGFYIYEEIPNFGKKSGITGRGLEGFTDSLLKVFGI